MKLSQHRNQRVLPGNPRQIRTNYRCSDQGLAGFACRISTTPDSGERENQPRSFRNGNLSGIRDLGQMLVRAIAKWRVPGLLTLAPPDGFFLGDFVFHRLQSRPFVGTIAKRRVPRAPAGAPPMGPGLNFEGEWLGIANDRFFRHKD